MSALARLRTVRVRITLVATLLTGVAVLIAGAWLTRAVEDSLTDNVHDADRARLGFPEVTHGFNPAYGVARLLDVVGGGWARDLILTGRGVHGEEALRMGLANRLVPHGQALDTAVSLAHDLARFPQRCLRSDRLSAYEQWSLSYEDGWRNELRRGRDVVESGETADGAASFARGKGRHGAF